MAQGVISAKYLYDIAEAIRVKSGSQSTITPAQMAAAIANIDGTISGTITPSTDTGVGVITDTIMAGIADAIRAKLDVQIQYSPSQMADAILSIVAPMPVPTIVSWASGTDEEIGAMIDAAHAGVIDLQQDGGWAVGNVRTITVGAFTGGGGVNNPEKNVEIVITSFDEYMSCGNVLQFDFKTSTYNGMRINTSNTNEDGYGRSEMKLTTLPAIVNALPSWLKNRLIEFSVLVSAGNNSSTIETVTGNKLALRSEIEVFGSTQYSYPGEGTHVAYYAAANARKKPNQINGNNQSWWQRSPGNTNVNSWGSVTNTGIQGTGSPASALRVAPFGCL